MLQKNRPLKRGAALSNQKETVAKKIGSSLNGGVKIGLAGAVLSGMLFFAGGFYLYQVNSVASAGFQLQNIQNKIQEYQKEGNDLEIQSTELQSTYNIEKSAKNLNLVNTANVSYIELDGPVAMK